MLSKQLVGGLTTFTFNIHILDDSNFSTVLMSKRLQREQDFHGKISLYFYFFYVRQGFYQSNQKLRSVDQVTNVRVSSRIHDTYILVVHQIIFN